MTKLAVLIAVATLTSQLSLAADFYIAPAGNDSAWGTRDRPLATLAVARDAARKAGTGPHRIIVMPGDYFLSTTLELDARDNGLTIEAAEAGKSTLYGGRTVSNWRRDGEKFWCADLPGVKEGAWDFRALVVNDRMPQRARAPESGTFLHQSKFDVPWLSSVAGGWERKPTTQELNTMLYDPKDVPATLDVRNAEVRIYHMWDESLVGVSGNDTSASCADFRSSCEITAGRLRRKEVRDLQHARGHDATRPMVSGPFGRQGGLLAASG